ncbi:hypothetical protein [Saccharopolyspora gregorii]|uniref:Uncharacterized protein n=1 Tax=Saccharopolyspora gregorii TaxID=33914 RepID=A0ABP6S356_9PSEU
MFIAMTAMTLATVISLIASLFGAFMVPAVLAAARVGITALLRELIKQIAQNIVKQLGRIPQAIKAGGWQAGAKAAGSQAWQLGKYPAGGAAFGAGVMGGLDAGIQGAQKAAVTATTSTPSRSRAWSSVVRSVVRLPVRRRCGPRCGEEPRRRDGQHQQEHHEREQAAGPQGADPGEEVHPGPGRVRALRRRCAADRLGRGEQPAGLHRHRRQARRGSDGMFGAFARGGLGGKSGGGARRAAALPRSARSRGRAT